MRRMFFLGIFFVEFGNGETRFEIIFLITERDFVEDKWIYPRNEIGFIWFFYDRFRFFPLSTLKQFVIIVI